MPLLIVTMTAHTSTMSWIDIQHVSLNTHVQELTRSLHTYPATLTKCTTTESLWKTIWAKRKEWSDRWDKSTGGNLISVSNCLSMFNKRCWLHTHSRDQHLHVKLCWLACGHTLLHPVKSTNIQGSKGHGASCMSQLNPAPATKQGAPPSRGVCCGAVAEHLA